MKIGGKRYGFARPITHTPSPAGTVTLNLNTAYKHEITMPAGNVTIAVSNSKKGIIFTVRILQDNTGSRTVTWFNTIKWAEGGTPPTLTTTANKADSFIFLTINEGNYDGFVVGKNI